MKPRLDILDYIADADYLVQLSDNEGFCYSVVEALTQDVPVIVTPCPVFEEIGLVDGVNCYKVPFDMKDFDVKKLLNIPKNFNYRPPADRWNELLLDAPST
jgi:glycosyltransferase involved in cell wall biosynthesis